MEACYKSITSAILSPALCFSSVKSLSTSHPYSEATFIVTQCSKCITILSFPLELPNATCYPHLSMKHPHLQDALLPLVSFPSLFAFWTTHRKWPPPCPRACSYARCRLPSVPGTRQELNREYFYFSELHHPVFNFCIHSTGRGSFFHPECVYHQGSHNIIRH